MKRLLKIFKRLVQPVKIEKIKIHREVLEDVIVMAKSSYPQEFISFFSGTVRKGIIIVDSLILQAYESSNSAAHFNISNMPLSASVLGTVHSHPSHSNRPSIADKRLFNKRGYFHAIIRYPYTLADIAFYDKYGERIEVEII